MHGIDVINTLMFVASALVLVGIFSSLIATRFGAPLLLVFLIVGMLAACGGATPAASTASPTAAASVTPTAPPSPTSSAGPSSVRSAGASLTTITRARASPASSARA